MGDRQGLPFGMPGNFPVNMMRQQQQQQQQQPTQQQQQYMQQQQQRLQQQTTNQPLWAQQQQLGNQYGNMPQGQDFSNMANASMADVFRGQGLQGGMSRGHSQLGPAQPFAVDSNTASFPQNFLRPTGPNSTNQQNQPSGTFPNMGGMIPPNHFQSAFPQASAQRNMGMMANSNQQSNNDIANNISARMSQMQNLVGGGQQSGTNLQTGQAPAGRRPMNPGELRGTIAHINLEINKLQVQLASVQNQGNTVSPEVMQNQLNPIRERLHNAMLFKQKASRAMAELTVANNQAQRPDDSGRNLQGGIGGMRNLGQTSQQISMQQNATTGGQSGQGWALNPPPMPARVPMPTQQPAQPRQMMPMPSMPVGNMEFNLGPSPNMQHDRISPALNLQAPPLQNFPLANQMVEPMDKASFDRHYREFCSARQIVRDEQMLSVSNRPVDLHQLHQQVLHEGGSKWVTEHDRWPVIGARMGWVQFPATSNEQARSGPGISIQLMHIYSKYLEAFDEKYLQSVIDKRHKTHRDPSMPLQNMNAQITPSNAQTSSMSPPMTNATMLEQRLRSHLNLVRLANASAAEMRTMGIPEQAIHAVEFNRPRLLTIQAAIANAPQTEHLSIVRQLTSQQAQQAAALASSSQAGVQSSAKPMSEEALAARQNMLRFRNEQIPKQIAALGPQDVADSQKPAFAEALSRAVKLADELDPRLSYLVVSGAIQVSTYQHVASCIATVQHQQQMLNNHRGYVIGLPSLQSMSDILVRFASGLQSSANINRPNAFPPTVPQQRLPYQPPAPTTQLSQPPIQNANRIAAQPPPMMSHRRQPSLTGQASVSTPPASNVATSPPANASSPNAMGSPKSPPKTRAAKAAKRAAPQPRRKASASTIGPTESASTPASANEGLTPAAAPSPASSLKREREPDAIVIDNDVSNAPSPKKAKADWEIDATETHAGHIAAAQKVKSDEDASQFFEQMQMLMQLPSDDQGASTLGIFEPFDDILKGTGHSAPNYEGTGSTSQLLPTPAPANNSKDDFADFFDWTSWGADGSKPSTPELVQSTSTNPSPASTTGDSSQTHDPQAVSEVTLDPYDPLRLGPLKEIDGGEAAYHSSGQWLWEGSMPVLDQPWAITS